MRKIKTLLLGAVALTCTSIMAFTGCTPVAPNGMTLSSNWYKNTSFGAIQDAAFTTKEVLTYSLDFIEGANATYSVNYDEQTSSYSTTFYATNYSWADQSVPQEFRQDTLSEVYVLESVLKLDGQYKFKSDTKAFNDITTTKSIFQSVDGALAPVYSYQEIRTTSPLGYIPTSIATTCIEYHYITESYYNYNCNKVITTCKNFSSDGNVLSEKTTGLEFEGNVYDTTTVYTAMRASNYDTDFQSLQDVYVPVTGKITECVISTNTENVEELKSDSQAYTAMFNKQYCPKDAKLTVAPITINANAKGAKAQTAWFVTVEDSSSNNTRSTMTKLELHLDYALGTLHFNLKSIDSSFSTSI